MRDPNIEGSTVIMSEIEIDNADIYNTYARNINDRVLIFLLDGAPVSLCKPIILAVEDCDEDDKEALAYRLAKEISRSGRLVPHKVSEYCYVFREKR